MYGFSYITTKIVVSRRPRLPADEYLNEGRVQRVDITAILVVVE